jgi:predicted kinase
VDRTVVALTGLPGTGKSMLGERLARRTGAPAFAGDWLLGALAPLGVLDDLDRPTVLSVYYGLLSSLVTRQLILGQSAVVDCVLDDATAARWRDDAERHGGRLLVVQCVCSDESVHRSRIEGRRRDIPGWHEVGWDHVERMRAEFRPVTAPDLTLDAVDPLDSNLTELTDLVLRRQAGRAATSMDTVTSSGNGPGPIAARRPSSNSGPAGSCAGDSAE